MQTLKISDKSRGSCMTWTSSAVKTGCALTATMGIIVSQTCGTRVAQATPGSEKGTTMAEDEKTVEVDELDVVEEDEASEEDGVVVLTDDEGEEVEFEYLDTIDYEGNEYVVLLPVDADEDEAVEVLILKVEYGEDEDDEQYVSVESEELLDKLFDIFRENNGDDFEFVEE